MAQRQIILDTETTGLEASAGHRIIEIGGVEVVNRRFTGRTIHHYLQPDRAIDPQAIAVHGITEDFLLGKPRFPDIANEFLDFVKGAELVIHNAAFDIGFINAELALWGGLQQPIESLCGVVDTLLLARARHPGQRNSLDALCKRYNIDNSRRELHGALLDAEILADVYLAMTGGQTALMLDTGAKQKEKQERETPDEQIQRPSMLVTENLNLRVLRASDDERQRHQNYLARLEKTGGAGCLWLQQEAVADQTP